MPRHDSRPAPLGPDVDLKVPMLNYTRYVGLFFPKRSSVVPYPSAAL